LNGEALTDVIDGLQEIDSQQKISIVRSLPDADQFVETLKTVKSETVDKIVSWLLARAGIKRDELDGRKLMLNWDEIRGMSGNHISFGSHAVSHRIMTYLPTTEVTKELMESKKIIEENLKVRVDYFAYPNGDYNSQVKQAVREAGYLCACTTRIKANGRNEIDLFSLPRIGVHEGMSRGITQGFSRAVFACKLVYLAFRRRK
jgi:peptidoglycan/xylan/chitin deacetylase (PgdA/CDA1 family)